MKRLGNAARNSRAEWDLSGTQQLLWRFPLARFHALDRLVLIKARDLEKITFPSRASLLAMDLSSSATEC